MAGDGKAILYQISEVLVGEEGCKKRIAECNRFTTWFDSLIETGDRPASAGPKGGSKRRSSKEIDIKGQERTKDRLSTKYVLKLSVCRSLRVSC